MPGWDCHGLPIEQKALTEMKGDFTVLEPLEIRAKGKHHLHILLYSNVLCDYLLITYYICRVLALGCSWCFQNNPHLIFKTALSNRSERGESDLALESVLLLKDRRRPSNSHSLKPRKSWNRKPLAFHLILVNFHKALFACFLQNPVESHRFWI